MQSIASCLAFSAHFMQYLVLQEGQVYTSPLISPLWRRQKFSLNFVEGGRTGGGGIFLSFMIYMMIKFLDLPSYLELFIKRYKS